ncbi:L-rhamnonate transporter [Escherichia coli]|nr:L-rhamnonate transporter [Escherichia coli]
MANITQYDNPLLNSAIQKSWKRLGKVRISGEILLG